MAGAQDKPTVLNPIDKQFEKITRYHLYFFIVYFISKLTTVWHTLNMLFLSPPMTYTCGSKPGTGTDHGKAPLHEGGPCPCDNPIWDYSVFTKTVQTKYGIICERRWLNSFSESMSFFGLLVGACIFGLLSDKYGRLTMYAICQFIMGGAGCLVTVMPNIYLFIVMRFCEGVGTGGAIVTGYVLCVEYCGMKYRATISSIMHFPSNFGLMLLTGLSYMLRNCDDFQLAASVPILAFIMVRFILWESPKWLLENRKDEAIKVMEKFCRFNKLPCPTLKDEIEAYHVSRNIVKEERMKFHHIFQYRRHTINFCCMAYLYFVCGMCYYGVSQFIGKMSTHVHRNTIFNAIFLSLGTFCSIFIVNRLGRRPFVRATMFLAGAFMFAVVFMPSHMPSHSWIKIMCACLSSTFFYMSFIIIFLYGVELFPTNIRNSVIGILSLTSRFGQILGPQINSFPTSVAGSIFGVLAFVASVVTFFLPETRGHELPSTLAEIPRHHKSKNVKFNNTEEQPERALKIT